MLPLPLLVCYIYRVLGKYNYKAASKIFDASLRIPLLVLLLHPKLKKQKTAGFNVHHGLDYIQNSRYLLDEDAHETNLIASLLAIG